MCATLKGCGFARWKTGPTAVFPSWGRWACESRLSVLLWCLCRISEAREMFQRSERISVSVERPKREHVSKRALLWGKERERLTSWEGVKGKVNWAETGLWLPGFLLLLVVVWIHILKMASCQPDSGSADRAELSGYFAWEVFVTGCFMGERLFSCLPWEMSAAVSGS